MTGAPRGGCPRVDRVRPTVPRRALIDCGLIGWQKPAVACITIGRLLLGARGGQQDAVEVVAVEVFILRSSYRRVVQRRYFPLQPIDLAPEGRVAIVAEVGVVERLACVGEPRLGRVGLGIQRRVCYHKNAASVLFLNRWARWWHDLSVPLLHGRLHRADEGDMTTCPPVRKALAVAVVERDGMACAPLTRALYEVAALAEAAYSRLEGGCGILLDCCDLKGIG